jgi:hypothetical protein
MRHSKIDLTMNVYTDPKLLDVHGTIERLPVLPLDGTDDDSEAATGTEGRAEVGPRRFAPGFASTVGNSCRSGQFSTTGERDDSDENETKKSEKPSDNARVPRVPLASRGVGDTGLEPATSTMSTNSESR